MSLPPLLKQRVLSEARRRPAPTRAEVRRRLLRGWLAAAVTGVLVLFAVGGPGHSAGRPPVYTVAMAAGVAVVATLATALVVVPGASMLGRSRRLLLAVIGLVPLAVFAWLVLFHERYAPPFSRVGYRCLGLTLATAVAPLVVMFGTRRAAVRAPVAEGAAFGAVAGAWAGVSVALWCPLSEPSHVAVGHVLPIVLLVIAAAAYSSRVVRRAL